MLLVHLFILRMYVFVLFLFLLMSRVGCGLWWWHTLDLPINFFYEYTFQAVIKIYVIISKVHSCDDISLCSGSSIFKTFAGDMLFGALIGTGKKNFFKHFLQSFRAKVLCNNSDQTCFSDTLTSAVPLGTSGDVEILSGSSFNISLGAQQMLMHRKLCFNPYIL